MAFIIIDAERYALQIGDNTLGGTGDDAVEIAALAPVPPFATITVIPGEPATVRPYGTTEAVIVDGVRLEASGRELRHGARIESAGRHVLFGDIQAAGSTRHVAGVTDDEAAVVAALLPGETTADTGGRLVARATGESFRVPGDGLVIGRDPTCLVALPLKEVSREHARIHATIQGYVLTDTSANGVQINGVRVNEQQLLCQGDVIGIAGREFRFEADTGVVEPAPELLAAVARYEHPMRARAAASPAPSAPPRPPAPTPPAPTPRAPHGRVAEPLPDAALSPLATLEVVTRGVLNGTVFHVERSGTQIGRGTHNDVRLADESVSGAHATLILRDRAWHVTDHRSTNGTYVDGERVEGEQALLPDSELRVGNVKLRFRQIAAPAPQASTRAIVGVSGGAGLQRNQ